MVEKTVKKENINDYFLSKSVSFNLTNLIF